MLSPIILDHEDQLFKLIEKTTNPESRGVFVFKHSTKCIVSRTVLNNLKREWNLKDLPFYYLDLLSFRKISNQVGDVFRVKHESPQLLYIRNGECKAHASHASIAIKDIERWINA